MDKMLGDGPTLALDRNPSAKFATRMFFSVVSSNMAKHTLQGDLKLREADCIIQKHAVLQTRDRGDGLACVVVATGSTTGGIFALGLNLGCLRFTSLFVGLQLFCCE